jgi:hypothetical protein
MPQPTKTAAPKESKTLRVVTAKTTAKMAGKTEIKPNSISA